ncbi:type II toxin-antitoxin system Xre/ParS family antitoxin [Methylocaldum sp.]|uniref:type II RES/Xre toxin-antitoxin system antitoxin n=1 Tax=Methylocaldum sp. TaxID=1969727 RepID=UPI002D6E4D46|nr:antitoxin Xre/MbcA/ParS toxin-binding domain-containing protein [Methylocaldum sp.]HYE34794.1 antitoxin Xre/MbcA/ParS toxin-binding domain-containing protein [Methylocaldum sp.]
MASHSNTVSESSGSRYGHFLARLGALLDFPGRLTSEEDLIREAPLRMRPTVLDKLAEEGLTAKELAMVLPPRTLSHRRAHQQSLSPDESDRALRMARLVALAETVFGNRDKALRWLRKPLKRLDHRTPMEILSTELGGRIVEEYLIQIDEGFAA